MFNWYHKRIYGANKGFVDCLKNKVAYRFFLPSFMGLGILFCIIISFMLALPACKDSSAEKNQSRSAFVYGKIPSEHRTPVKLSDKAKAGKIKSGKIKGKEMSGSLPNTKVVNIVDRNILGSHIDNNKKSIAGKNITLKKNIALKNNAKNFGIKGQGGEYLKNLFTGQQTYNADGKIDPFAPLINTAAKKAPETAQQRKPRRILTPLEKFDFSQIRLVAVIIAKSGNIAMVEDSTHKGYTIRVGTYIGRNGGRVVKIENDRVIVKERIRNFKGEYIMRLQVLKLNKPDNGD